MLLPQKFNKQVFDGRRNDPRDVPRMAPLRAAAAGGASARGRQALTTPLTEKNARFVRVS